MTTLTEARPSKADDGIGLVPYRLTVDQFNAMIDAGVFPDEARVELLEGILAEKMTQYPPHAFTVDQLVRLLRILLEPGWVVRQEHPVILGQRWRPEPDAAVCRGPRDRYRAAHPGAADLALVAEVSDSTYPIDRGIKWRGYAGAGVPAYWIVDLEKRTVEVFTDPSGQGDDAGYRASKTYAAGDSVPVVVEGRERGAIAVADFLP